MQFPLQSPIPIGAVIEWYAQPTSIRLGIISNLPRKRRIARVRNVNYSTNFVTAYDPDGIRCVVPLRAVTVICDHAEAGWGNL